MDDKNLQIANAHFVTPFLAVGGDLAFNPAVAQAQADELVAAGVSHILDVRLECDDADFWAQRSTVSYRWAGIDDAGQQVPPSWFDGCVTWALRAIEDGGVVLTHCHMGINRGPSAGFAVLLGLGWDPVDALAAIRAARPFAAIAYAEDALLWHGLRNGISEDDLADIACRVTQWRLDNPLDVRRIIRGIRRDEAAGLLRA